jgi:putative oxidoreductase
MLRTLPAWIGDWRRDVLLLAARVLVSVVMLAHVWLTFVVTGFSGTVDVFANLGIPIAIAASALTLVLELIGSILLILGVWVGSAAAGFTFVMGGAIYFVHAPHGIFVTDGGWELVGVIIAVVLAVAANGPGRLSVAHLVERYRSRRDTTARPVAEVRKTPPQLVQPTQIAPATAATEPVTDARGFSPVSARFVPLGRRDAAPAPRPPADNAGPGDAWDGRHGDELRPEAAGGPTGLQSDAAPVWTEQRPDGLFTSL